MFNNGDGTGGYGGTIILLRTSSDQRTQVVSSNASVESANPVNSLTLSFLRHESCCFLPSGSAFDWKEGHRENTSQILFRFGYLASLIAFFHFLF